MGFAQEKKQRGVTFGSVSCGFALGIGWKQLHVE